nr:hypothetical protein Iba_chr12bCG0500 [Ipomoea batatas]
MVHRMQLYMLMEEFMHILEFQLGHILMVTRFLHPVLLMKQRLLLLWVRIHLVNLREMQIEV